MNVSFHNGGVFAETAVAVSAALTELTDSQLELVAGGIISGGPVPVVPRAPIVPPPFHGPQPVFPHPL